MIKANIGDISNYHTPIPWVYTNSTLASLLFDTFIILPLLGPPRTANSYHHYHLYFCTSRTRGISREQEARIGSRNIMARGGQQSHS